MLKLRQRPRADSFQNQPRRGSGLLGRRVYLVMLAALALAVANYVWGDMLFLRADGLVLREKILVAATSIVRVEEVAVREGQTVDKDELLLRVGSIDVLEKIAEYATRNAELAEREAALNSRQKLVLELFPLAEARVVETERLVKGLKGLRADGMILSQRFEEVTVSAYEARIELVRLRVERDSLKGEIDALSTARGHSVKALEDLEAHYAEGIFRAAKTGRIGDHVPSVGEVFRAGEPIMSVISGRPYVLAYLPQSYWFALEAGMPVDVESGRIEARGEIVEVLPVSSTVPPEFQNTFKPDPTRQLARVEFSSPPPFPTSANVRVTRPGLTEKIRDWVSGFKLDNSVASDNR